MILELLLLHIEWGFELASCNGSKLVLSSVSSENRMVKQPYFAGNSAGDLFGMVLCPFKGIVGDLLTESKGHSESPGSYSFMFADSVFDPKQFLIRFTSMMVFISTERVKRKPKVAGDICWKVSEVRIIINDMILT